MILSEHLGFQIDVDGIDTIGRIDLYRLGYLPAPLAQNSRFRVLAITVRRSGRNELKKFAGENKRV